MRFFQLEALMALATMAMGSCATSVVCPRSTNDAEALANFKSKLSAATKIYFPGSEDFTRASKRWSMLETPQVNVVVVPATDKDVAEIIKYSNACNIPYLAYNGAHGATTTLGKMDYGIEIYLEQLNSVSIDSTKNLVTVGGGINSKKLIDALWDAGKQTVTGTCECVSYMGPALGGGHGWLQGRYGLLADQFVSMKIVLADGTLKTVDAKHELMWALKGAGHNFGIVTSVTSKIYDIKHSDWAIETHIYSGDQVEQIYKVGNDLINGGNQPVDVIHWSYWVNDATIDANKPVIIYFLIQEGVKSIDPIHSKPFRDIKPIVTIPDSGSYRDVSRWTGIDMNAPPCQKSGLVNPRFPIYLENFNIPAMRQVYDIYAAGVGGQSIFNNSIFMFEAYSHQGLRAIDSTTTAFAFRGDNVLAAPLISYKPGGSDLDAKAAALGNQIRDALHKATGRSEKHVYVNYAFGNENQRETYGAEKWRQTKYTSLKKKYDPKGKFSFYNPIKI